VKKNSVNRHSSSLIKLYFFVFTQTSVFETCLQFMMFAHDFVLSLLEPFVRSQANTKLSQIYYFCNIHTKTCIFTPFSFLECLREIEQWRISRENSMTQQAKGPTWTRVLTIVLYLIFASLPALSFAIFYSSLWARFSIIGLFLGVKSGVLSRRPVYKKQAQRQAFQLKILTDY
jgi:hypothetical protein